MKMNHLTSFQWKNHEHVKGFEGHRWNGQKIDCCDFAQMVLKERHGVVIGLKGGGLF